jgi:hypothetical protein
MKSERDPPHPDLRTLLPHCSSDMEPYSPCLQIPSLTLENNDDMSHGSSSAYSDTHSLHFCSSVR